MKDLKRRDLLITIYREIAYACEEKQDDRCSLLRQIFQDIDGEINFKSEKISEKTALLHCIKEELEKALTVIRNTYSESRMFCVLLSKTQQKRIFHIQTLLTAYQKAANEREKFMDYYE